MVNKEQVRLQLKNLSLLTPAKNRRSSGTSFYICPICGSGTGPKATGAFAIKDSTPTHWHCFACDNGGDIYDLFALMNHKDIKNEFVDVAKITYDYLGLQDEYEIPDNGSKQQKAEETTQTPLKEEVPPQNFTEYIKQSKSLLLNETNDTIVDYITSRGITPDTIDRFNLGYDNKTKRIVIPSNPDNTHYQARTLNHEESIKYLNAKGVSPQIFNIEALYDDRPGACFVVEGPFCAMSLEQNGAAAISIGGVTGVDRFLQQLVKRPPKKVLAIALDNDEHGIPAQRQLIEQLTEIGISFLEVRKDDYKGQKDFNDILKSDFDGLKELCAQIQNPEEYIQIDIIKERKEYEKHNAATLANIYPLDKSQAIAPISTGFQRIDDYFDGGLYPGLYVIGAISSLGKTSLVVQMADNIAAAGHDVLYISLEMAAQEIVSKSLSRLTYEVCKDDGLPMSNAKTLRGLSSNYYIRNYTESDKKIIEKARNRYQAYGNNIRIIEGMGDIGVKEITGYVYKHEKLTGKKPVLIVDYLQIIAPADVRASDKQNTDKAVLELKRLSRDMGIPVVAISSFNRQNYSEEVNNAAFKESGAIEYSADVLMGLQLYGAGGQNFKAKEALQKPIREVEAVILKNRNGRSNATISLDFHPLYNSFEECFMDRSEAQEVSPLEEQAKKKGRNISRH